MCDKMRELIPSNPAPPFSLPSTSNREISLWDYKQKNNLLLLFIGDRSIKLYEPIFTIITNEYSSLKKLKTETLVISLLPLHTLKEVKVKLQLKYQLLSYPSSRIAEKYGIDITKIFFKVLVIDRFCDIHYHQSIIELAEFSLKEFVDWIEFLENQCPEYSHL